MNNPLLPSRKSQLNRNAMVKAKVDAMKVGDTFTIAGGFKRIPNPNRLWWQFWKPREIVTSDLTCWTVV